MWFGGGAGRGGRAGFSICVWWCQLLPGQLYVKPRMLLGVVGEGTLPAGAGQAPWGSCLPVPFSHLIPVLCPPPPQLSFLHRDLFCTLFLPSSRWGSLSRLRSCCCAVLGGKCLAAHPSMPEGGLGGRDSPKAMERRRGCASWPDIL